jgi:hypothetical protein
MHLSNPLYVCGWTITLLLLLYIGLFTGQIKVYCTMLHLFDDLWLDKIIPKNNDDRTSRIIYLPIILLLYHAFIQCPLLITTKYMFTLIVSLDMIIDSADILLLLVCTMLHLFDDLWLDKIIPKNNDDRTSQNIISALLAWLLDK